MGSNGNGSAMRAAPIGVAFSKSELEVLRRVAVDQGIITHNSSSCSAAAVAIATAARLAAVTPQPLFDVKRFVDAIATVVKPVDSLVAKQIEKFLENDWLNVSTDEALLAIVKAGVECGDGTWGDGEIISASAVQASLWALYSFLKNQNDWVGCVATAIEGGGDTDTTAAMAGAICGAHVGLEGIPKVFSEKLHDKDSWNYDELIAMAEELYELVESGSVRYE